jgi:hypothetical protein
MIEDHPRPLADPGGFVGKQVRVGQITRWQSMSLKGCVRDSDTAQGSQQELLQILYDLQSR